MKKWLILLGAMGCFSASAHIGSPNVFFQGNAGAYPVRVVIRPPEVVPGLAEISVRVESGATKRVSVLPLFSNAGRNAAPSPDEARLVRGETNLYTAALWLMRPGAYSVEVSVEGALGTGSILVPVNSVATNTRPMSRAVAVVLLLLGGVLFLSAVRIVGAIFGEGLTEPGAPLAARQRRSRRWAMAASVIIFSLMLYGGKKWWDYEDQDYRNNLLYRPIPVSARIRSERRENILKLVIDSSAQRGRWTPLIPDHGKIMHLFLVEPNLKAFAHLHPVARSRTEFEVPLPPLPAARYQVYADATHEDGFAETLIATAEIPESSAEMKLLWLGQAAEPICSLAAAQMLATNLFFPPDPDDSWVINSSAIAGSSRSSASATSPAGRTVTLSNGYKMIGNNLDGLVQNRDVSLRFRLLLPDGTPARLEPYMGMLGHTILRRVDGSVFAHVHPEGTFSMAARAFFSRTDRATNLTASLPSAAADHDSHSVDTGVVTDVTFPYAFPQAGQYRLWVQMKSRGEILTGVFDVMVEKN